MSYERKLADIPLEGLEIKTVDPVKGNGVFATKSFVEGECVWEETKFVGIQHQESKELGFLNCSYCMRQLGALEDSLYRQYLCKPADDEAKPVHSRTMSDLSVVDASQLSENPFPESGLPLKELDETLVSMETKIIKCRINALYDTEDCEEFYCSEECEKKAFDEYHHFLCCGGQSPAAAILTSFQCLALGMIYVSTRRLLYIIVYSAPFRFCIFTLFLSSQTFSSPSPIVFYFSSSTLLTPYVSSVSPHFHLPHHMIETNEIFLLAARLLGTYHS